VTVRFNKDIDTDSVNTDSFYILNSKGKKVDGNTVYNQTSYRLKFFPVTRWDGLERHTVHIKSTITDKSKLFELDQDYTWWFETEEYIIPMGTIYGQVINAYNSQNKDPINDVVVTLSDRNNKSNVQNTTTDSSGRFTFSIQYGEFELVAEKESYQRSGGKDIFLNDTSLDVIIELARPEITDISLRTRVDVDEKFKASVTAEHPYGQEINYYWDFGDNTIKPGQAVTHKYKKTGTYEVTLTVQDDNNAYVTYKETIVVSAAEETVDYFSIIIVFSIIMVLIGLLAIYLTVRRGKESRLKAAEARWEKEHDRSGIAEDEDITEEEMEEDYTDEDELDEEELTEESEDASEEEFDADEDQEPETMEELTEVSDEELLDEEIDEEAPEPVAGEGT
jgi:hypothetical protein